MTVAKRRIGFTFLFLVQKYCEDCFKHFQFVFLRYLFYLFLKELPLWLLFQGRRLCGGGIL